MIIVIQIIYFTGANTELKITETQSFCLLMTVQCVIKSFSSHKESQLATPVQLSEAPSIRFIF